MKACEGLPENVEIPNQWARAPVINSRMGLLCWPVCAGVPDRLLVIIDLLRGEYRLVDTFWEQVALLESAVSSCGQETGQMPM